ncbi:DNA excision repair protein ercc-6 [Globisporangium polare]
MSAVSPTETEQVTPPPSPSRFAFDELENEEAVESDTHSDDSDYVPGASSAKKSKGKSKAKSKKRLRQGGSGSDSKKKKKAAVKSRGADGDEEAYKPDDDDDDKEEISMGSPARSVSPSGGKFKSSKKQKKDAKNWLDDGCALTFAKRIEDFKRELKKTMREERVSFYNNPRPQIQTQSARQVDDEEEKDGDSDLLDDGAFHDEVVAPDQTIGDAIVLESTPETDEEQYYAPDDTIQTDSGLVVPKYIYTHLFPHQKECLEWLLHLHERNTGGILGDEMGLGKTVQIAAFLGAMHHERRVRTVLLLCPASVLLQWVREFHKWYPLMRVVLLHGSGSGMTLAGRTYAQLIQEVLEDGDDEENHMVDSGGGVVISTYENVRQYQELFMDVEWDYVVLDEGHRIRNPDAEITLVCKQLKTVHRIILTGTPIQNRLRELWSLFDFVYPGKLGTLPTFDDEFVLPIRTGGYANASKMQVLMAYKCALVLKDLINPYLLRRTKKEIQHVTKMPEKMEQIIFCSLTPRQRSAYQTYLNSSEVASVLRRDIRPFRAISILRHICNHPDLLATVGDNGVAAYRALSGEIEDYGAPEGSGKMLVLGKILSMWKEQGHRVLLFTQTRKMLDILESLMARLGYVFCRLDGTTSVKERQSLLDAFNADGSKIFIFLLTTRAGGIGINLIGADRVVIFDPDWNPSTDLQARERSWRLGQTKQVTIYRLITSGTIEEKIYHRQIFKQYLTSKVLHDAKRKRCFNKHSLRDLFVLGDEKDQGGAETNDLFIAGNVENPTALAVGTDDEDDEAKRDGEEDGQVGDEGFEEDDGDKEAGTNSASAGDNDAILKKLFDGEGIRGVFNHDAVECDGVQNQEADLIDMESSKIAKSALSSLRASCALIRQQRESLFTPTWTGRSGVAGDPTQRAGRFGNRVARGRQPPASLGSAGSSSSNSVLGVVRRNRTSPAQQQSTATTGRSLFAQKTLSSHDMLAKIKMRKNGVAQSSTFIGNIGGPSLKNGFMGADEMAKQLHAFLTPSSTDPRRRNGVTTEDLLETFATLIAPKDKLVFRNLLRDMAECCGRKWTLKQEFVTEPS